MTIKNNGGVFGRHPTFSSADIDGNLTVTGDTSAAKTVLVGTTNSPLLTLRANNDSGNPGLSNTLRFEDIDTATQPGQQTGRIEFYMADSFGSGAGVNSYINVDSDQFGGSTFTIGTGQTGTLAERLRISYLGDVTVSTGNLVIGTSGNGIDFSATSGTGTSELFDDYEEGTWTPVVVGSSSVGTASYAAQNGKYTKIGNQVFFEAYVSYSSGTGTGNLRISGLPYTHAGGATYGAVSIGEINGIALSANNVASAEVSSGSTSIFFYQNVVGGGTVTAIPYDAAGFITFGGHYTTS